MPLGGPSEATGRAGLSGRLDHSALATGLSSRPAAYGLNPRQPLRRIRFMEPPGTGSDVGSSGKFAKPR